MRRPRTVRGRLLLAVMTAAAVLVAIATVALAEVLAHALSDDADDVARLQASAALATVRVVGGHIAAGPTGTFDSQAWVLEGQRVVAAPGANPAVTRAIVPYVQSGREFFDVPGQSTRLYATPVLDHAGARVGTLVVGISLVPFRGTQRVSVILCGGCLCRYTWWNQG